MEWQRFLDDNHIPWVGKGPNTKRGEISIQCPYCGDDDPSHHLGISLTTAHWGCLRDRTHRGVNPARLVAALTGCSQERAKAIVRSYDQADPETLDDALAALEGTTAAPKPGKRHAEPLRLPDDFMPIRNNSLTGKFYRYLSDRGFDDVDGLSRTYQLHCAMTGKQKDRIIIPLHQDGELIGWTGRALINPVNAPRYLTSGPETKKAVFNEDRLRRAKGRILFVVEGPFDAIKLDWYGMLVDARACCTFGTTFSLDQVSIITELSRNFERTVTLFDPEAVGPGFDIADWLARIRAVQGRVPDEVEDPGAMNPKQIVQMVAAIVKEHRLG